MRPLRVLLVCFGFLFGLLIAAVGLLIDWAIGVPTEPISLMSTATRTDL